MNRYRKSDCRAPNRFYFAERFAVAVAQIY